MPSGQSGTRSWCPDCRKWDDEHETCAKCGHPDCDCICEFLRNVWPTHSANPAARR